MIRYTHWASQGKYLPTYQLRWSESELRIGKSKYMQMIIDSWIMDV